MKLISLHKNLSYYIGKAQKKDRKSQQVIYEMFSSKMLSVCRSYISDLHFAEDVMMKGFLKVFNNIHSYKSEGSFEGWIRRIMIRESISYLRVTSNKFLVQEVNENEDFITDELNSIFSVDQIQTCIDSLPEGYKVVFLLYAVEGYKHSEIAKLLNISEGTSKSQLSRARKTLQELLNTIENERVQ